jgi:beta-phosphoglucomutase-like phosphatase (HAD superfamily)
MNREQAFVFDLDGTLVDSVYQHVLAWQEALDHAGIEVSVWRIHRRIGMSGGLLAHALLRETGRPMSSDDASRLRQLHADAYRQRMSQVRVLPGARELLARLSELEVPWAIATSGYWESAGPVLERLGVAPEVPVITRDAVDRAKPDPDLFLAAAARLRPLGRHHRPLSVRRLKRTFARGVKYDVRASQRDEAECDHPFA